MRVDSDRVGLDSLPINGSVIPAAAAANADGFQRGRCQRGEFLCDYECTLIRAFVSGQRPRDFE